MKNMGIEPGDIEIYYGNGTIQKLTLEPSQVKLYPVPRPSTAQEPGFGVGDSGCGCCMVGQETIDKYATYFKKEFDMDARSRRRRRPSASGTTARRRRRRKRPSPSIGMEDVFTGQRTQGILRAAVVPGGAPLVLLSKNFLTNLGAVLFAAEQILFLRQLGLALDLPEACRGSHFMVAPDRFDTAKVSPRLHTSTG